ncbi:MAG: hypothetical protein KDK04_14475 [Candidatus Competibacteraceae bacterium]|nr:hypothetical protein [Candidatus Competibacteraceae bacterium]MCB1804631.1 hypothetical protein [Candidatus Competibacteraceae bacterium]MCB1812906.1 hypothetical protein [Candidatus Competibacteraceae bacterium]
MSSEYEYDRTFAAWHLALFGAERIGTAHTRNIVEHPAATLRYIIDPVAQADYESLVSGRHVDIC